jgi:carboxyl-terminal processing protease
MDQLGLPHPYDPGALKVTISKFYRPSGASTQRRGVASDIVIPSTTDFSEMGETSLPDALPWDGVPRASFHALDEVRPYVDVLRKASVQRVAGDEGFIDQAAEITRIRLRLSTKSVSLNEAERRAELAQDKARSDARTKREQTAHDATVTYPITLENLGAPGLPPPATAAVASARDEHGAARGRDEVLGESERILTDYVGLLSR